MSGVWNTRDYRYAPWSHQNQYENSYDNRFANENNNMSRFPLDRSRSRAPAHTANSHFGDYRSYSDYRNYRNRNNNRRSLSAPRTVCEEDKNWWSSKQAPNNPSRRVTYLPNRHNDQSVCIGNAKKSDNFQRSQNKLNNFRSIFIKDTGTSSAPIETGTLSNSVTSLVQKTNTVINQLEHNAKHKEVKANHSPDKILKNLVAKEINQTHSALENDQNMVTVKPSQEVQGNDHMIKYYGESLNEMKNKELPLCNIELPIVNWPKEPSTMDNLPEYDSKRCVGGDGLTLEIFYLCKYCKMFTGGCQIDAHLKSRYHYDHYKEFLKTEKIATTSTSSDSECESKISKTPEKQTEFRPIQPTAMEIDDSADIVYNCHQELDYDEDLSS